MCSLEALCFKTPMLSFLSGRLFQVLLKNGFKGTIIFLF